jgi:gamma-glutamylcyclotransferase (GGCT)/AIG2-like uncharacterized protein YtfP
MTKYGLGNLVKKVALGGLAAVLVLGVGVWIGSLGHLRWTSKKYQLAVNGTLMRGLSLNENLVKAGATFLRETKTSNCYRLWSINDRYPGMIRTTPPKTGHAITVEVWELAGEGLVAVLDGEPPGLAIGRVELQDGTRVYGVLAEPYLVEGQREITDFGGWREYKNQSTEHTNNTR